jgi:1-acyl-sn-glycerol-3-phosphate acyltransferase
MPNPVSRLFLFPVIKKIFNFKHEGLNKVPKEENYIFAMNHQGALDLFVALAVLVPHAKRPLSVVLTSQAYDFPILNLLFKRWQAIRIDHSNPKDKKKALVLAKKALDKGNNVLIFPEGNIIGGAIGSPTRAFTGVTRLAIMSKKKIIPVGIKGSFGAWKFPMSIASRFCQTKDKEKIKYRPTIKWNWLNVAYNFFELNFRHPVKMNFGKAFDLGKYYKLNLKKYNDENKRQLRIVTTQLMMQIAQLAGQKYNYDC